MYNKPNSLKCLNCLKIHIATDEEYNIHFLEYGTVVCRFCGSVHKNRRFSFPLNYLVSIPRSGSTWIRYFVECLTQRNTIGYVGSSQIESGIFTNLIPMVHMNKITETTDENVPILIKRHDKYGIERNDSARVIFAMRDYKECLLRDSANLEELLAKLRSYGDILDFYDKFDGDKMLVKYESMIENQGEIIESVLRFLNKFDEKKLENFLRDIESHKTNCLDIYGESKTMGKTKKHHQLKFNNSIIDYCDNYMKDNHPNLWNKYLKTYEAVSV
jgi:hypothetical protein